MEMPKKLSRIKMFSFGVLTYFTYVHIVYNSSSIMEGILEDHPNPVSSSPRSACKLEGGPDLRLHARCFERALAKVPAPSRDPLPPKNAAADAQKPATEL
ncbi:hypothetical protein CEXT_712421 [Caerostris extrusa]|uniref:Uncharacterized protein n=1 Tax=Caerostris extrusa TaxID=172846 RepID=A0AAV4U4D8_CAEEX|nr:hypothetical protein CEXT_712421 [Caerostris extrusa]